MTASPLTVIYNSDYDVLAWVSQVNNMSQPPLVHSLSYALDERTYTSKDYMLAANIGFMKAGVRGS